ncbi:gas vesicle protein GvpL [soil metagenome]
MGVHVYCVVPAGLEPQSELRGVEGAVVYRIDAGAVALLVSDHAVAPRADIDAVRAHNDVVAAAMDRAITPVPIRFGQWFDDAADAAERTAAEPDRWRTLLDRFAGRAEYGVRVTLPDAPAREMHAARPDTGTAYMAQLARHAAGAAHMKREAERLARMIAERASVAESRVADAGEGAASIAYLLAWDDVAAYHTIVDAVRDTESSLRLLCTGPWPPYSFVE